MSADTGNTDGQVNELMDRNQKGSRELRISLKWSKLARMLLKKSEKERTMAVLGRWKTLIRGLTAGQLEHEKTRQLRLSARWNLLARKLLAKDRNQAGRRAIDNWLKLYLALKRYEYQIYQERRTRKLLVSAQWTKMARLLLQRHNKTNHLRVLGRWRVLYLGLKTSEFSDEKRKKVRTMMVNATWARLARMLVQKENKLQSLKVLGRWRRLYLGLKHQDAELPQYKERKRKLVLVAKWNVFARELLRRQGREYKMKVMRINATWRKLARRLIQKENQRETKLKSLANVSKWQRFSRTLLAKEDKQREARVLTRWKTLLKGLAGEPDNELNLFQLTHMKRSQIIAKLRSRHQKTKTINTLGRWRVLIQGQLQ